MKEFDKFEPRRPLSKEQKDARKELRAADARVAMAEHEKTTEAFTKNRERRKPSGSLVRLARLPTKRG